LIQTTFNLSATAPPPNPTALKYDPQVTTLSIYEHTTEDEVLVRQAESIYSADIIRPMSSAKSVGRARGVIQLEGRLWCCTGTGGRRVMLDEVLPGLFPDMPSNVKYSYSGEVIQYRGTTYTFTYRRMYLNYKPPATLPAALYIGDKPGMLELCSQMSVGVFDGRCRASSIDLLGRRWVIYDADLSLGIQARLLLARIEIRGNHDTTPVEIPPEHMQDHQWVGKQMEIGCNATLTVMPELLTVICPGSFYTTRKGWIKELNYMPDDDDEDDIAVGEEDEDIEDAEEPDEEPAPAAPIAPAAPARRNTASNRTAPKLTQQTFF